MGTLVAAGCGANDAPLCEQARDHVQACFPEQDARVPDSCGDTMAEELLAKDCEELTADASATDGAADGYCNPFFWWLCSGSSSEPEPSGYSFRLGVNTCETELCTEDLFGEVNWGADCGKVTLETSDGEVVATDYVNDHLTWGGVQDTGPGFDGLDLPPGDYTARLWKADGELATLVEGGPAEIGVTLEEDGEVSLSRRNFKILRSEAELVRACADVRGSLTSSCDGAQQSDEDTEWSWIVRIEGEHTEGIYANYDRARKFYQDQVHHFDFPLVRAGRYTLTYVEVDISSSWVREDRLNSTYDDYAELVDRYATGEEVVDVVEITPEQIAAGEDVQVGHIDLETGVCL